MIARNIDALIKQKIDELNILAQETQQLCSLVPLSVAPPREMTWEESAKFLRHCEVENELHELWQEKYKSKIMH